MTFVDHSSIRRRWMAAIATGVFPALAVSSPGLPGGRRPATRSKLRQHPRRKYTTIDAPRPIDDFSNGNIAWGINDRGEVVIPDPTIALLPVATS